MIEYFTIGVIALLASASPGPDFVIVAKNALAHNRRMAIITSLGVGAGMLIHTTYCVLGLAVVIANSTLIFNIIKYLGASYLIYLGLKSLFSKSTLPARTELASSGLIGTGGWIKAFRDGLVTNALNPKVTLFMLSIFTVVINPQLPRLTQIGYGIEIACITGAWFVFLSIGLTHKFIYNKINSAQHLVNKIIGIILIVLGLIVVLGK